MDRLKIGISIGDINGIGLEVILKTLIDERITKLCTPIIYGSSKIVSYHKNIVSLPDFQYQSIRGGEQAEHGKINIVNCWNDSVNITLGKVTDIGGQYAFKSLEAAVKDLKAGVIDPTKVSRIALENAASVAAMLLTTDCVLAEKKEDAPAMPMGNPGMGGMGGMM